MLIEKTTLMFAYVLLWLLQNEYKLVVNSALDRETHTELNVTILCSDSGSPPHVNTSSLVVCLII